MDIIHRDQVPIVELPGRRIQTVAGKGAVSASARMTMGFSHYSDESGPMQPHQHAEEICYVLESANGWVERGESPEHLAQPTSLSPGMTLHIPALGWHVFRWLPGGHLDIIFFYGQVDHIRPEDDQ